MAGTRCLPACSTALEPPSVWGLEPRSCKRSARLLPPCPAPQAPPPLLLQLLLQRVEEAPVGTLADDLLGDRLDHAGLLEAEGVEADRILRIILSPLVVGDVLHELDGEVIVGRDPLVHEEPGGPLRLTGADVSRSQNRAQRPVDGHRALPDEFPVRGHQAAEVLGPGSVYHAINQYVPDSLRPEFLRVWRKGHVGIDLPL